jgi:hypothetical protein
MTLIRVIDSQTIWPYSLGQLRQDEPQRSFSNSPSDREFSVFGVFRVQGTAQPEIDPATEKAVEVVPALVDGVWLQQWSVVELSDAEREAYFRAMNPPRWQAFGQAVWSNPSIGAMLRGGLQADQTTPVSMALPVGLGQAAQDQSYDTFINAAQAAYHAGLLAVPLLTGIATLADQFYLPLEFVARIRAILAVMPLAFQPPVNPARFDEWTAPDGSEWVFDQPRGADGQYLVDDPETEAIESSLRWLPAGGEL